MKKTNYLYYLLLSLLIYSPHLLAIDDLWKVPDDSSIPDNAQGELITYGQELIRNTSKHLKQYKINNLNCQNCHLNAGKKRYAAPFVGVVDMFPQYRRRENKIGSIENRINGCMQRSMNGNKMPTDSKEMKAIVAYMDWLGSELPKDQKVEGRGFPKVTIPNRKADIKAGKKVYQFYCETCHGDNGQGLPKTAIGDTDPGYVFPPLWGEDSYNEGAGMHRVLKAMRFIKHNMPLGVSYDRPLLTDDQAYDVAAYINSFARPEKANKENDFPDRSKKPVDSPYPPYMDEFPTEQHKYGPFPPIIEFYQNLKK